MNILPILLIFAAPVSVDFVRVTGPDSITQQHLVEAIQDCSSRLAAATNNKVTIKVTSLTEIPQYSDSINSLSDSDRVTALNDSVAMAKVLGLNDKRHLVHFIQPPALVDGGRWYAGRAQSICKAHGVSMSNAGIKQEHSVVGLCHELGHTLGMSHLEDIPATMMHPNALAYDATRLEFSSKSIRQMRLCRKRLKNL